MGEGLDFIDFERARQQLCFKLWLGTDVGRRFAWIGKVELALMMAACLAKAAALGQLLGVAETRFKAINALLDFTDDALEFRHVGGV